MRWTAARTHWVGWVAVAAGAVLCVLGWYGISGERYVARQLPYLASSTIPGAALIVAGSVLVAARQPREERAEADEAWSTGSEPSAPEPPGPVAVSTDPPVRVPGGKLYHRPDCPLVAGKPGAEPVPGREPVLSPCPVCEPQGETH
ncbi:hypothetical protein ACFXJ5_25035 [Streptomyces sp. NPDC059373]